jgi:iodotyrosine deiodinase
MAFIPYHPTFTPTDATLLERSLAYYTFLNTRRTVRDFPNRPVDRAVIETLVMTASTAPSGAHKQPWTFCVVGNPDLKRQIREAGGYRPSGWKT